MKCRLCGKEYDDSEEVAMGMSCQCCDECIFLIPLHKKGRKSYSSVLRHREYQFIRNHRSELFRVVGKVCSDCGSSKNIHLHHLSYDINIPLQHRLIPLCKSCHMKRHPHMK